MKRKKVNKKEKTKRCALNKFMSENTNSNELPSYHKTYQKTETKQWEAWDNQLSRKSQDSEWSRQRLATPTQRRRHCQQCMNVSRHAHVHSRSWHIARYTKNPGKWRERSLNAPVDGLWSKPVFWTQTDAHHMLTVQHASQCWLANRSTLPLALHSGSF